MSFMFQEPTQGTQPVASISTSTVETISGVYSTTDLGLGRIALIAGLGGEAGFGENVLNRNDDGFSAPVDITSVFENGLNFYGRVFTQLWVNNNGSITFNGGRSTFTPTAITENSQNPEISAFFADVDTRGGEVTASPGGNSTGSNRVWYDLDTVGNRLIFTWDDVGYYASRTDKTNAFQIILTQVGNSQDFDIEFRYEDINWTTGGASGGVNGLGGTVARAGYTAGTGDPAAYFELPASGNQEAILDLDSTPGNTGQIGRWIFNVRSGDIATANIPALPPVGPWGQTVGDPHLVTLDGVGYDFHAAGEYVLIRATDDSGFEVQARFLPVGGDVSVNGAIAARLDGGRKVTIDATDAQPLRIDGTVAEIEDFGSIDVGVDRIYREGNRYTIVLAGEDNIINDGDGRLIVTVHDGRLDIDVRLNDAWAGRVEGLLGDGDGNPDNDIALANGTPLARPLTYASLYGRYRADWRVTSEEQSLFHYDAGESPDSFYIWNYPSAMVSLDNFSAAEVEAASAVVAATGLMPGSINFNNAVLDYLVTGDTGYIDSSASTTIVAEGNAAPIVAAADLRIVNGTAGNDTITGESGRDRIYGRGGDDLLEGGAGNDTLYGGTGNDTLHGGAGDDRLYGDEGDDHLFGGAGADRLDGGAGANTLNGGLGNDRYVIRSADDVIEGEIGFSQGGGIDTVESWISYTLPSNVEILRLQGTEDLNGSGNWAPEAIIGNAGNNVLDGSGGNDVLNGKDGNDTLIGGAGADSLVGEAGADVFLFRSVSESRPGQENRDFINGFFRDEGDKIDLSQIDANTTVAGNQAFSFIGSRAFSGQAGELRWFTWGGENFNIVEADVDGDRQADFQIFVNLTNTMQESDFIL